MLTIIANAAITGIKINLKFTFIFSQPLFSIQFYNSGPAFGRGALSPVGLRESMTNRQKSASHPPPIQWRCRFDVRPDSGLFHELIEILQRIFNLITFQRELTGIGGYRQPRRRGLFSGYPWTRSAPFCGPGFFHPQYFIAIVYTQNHLLP
jgi:hypothetical protein